jgi:A/G-specific adenine glycosylase
MDAAWSDNAIRDLQRSVFEWYDAKRRHLPWRGDAPPYSSTTLSDAPPAASRCYVSPYATWVSEIMLQQTRVETVIPFFLRWMDKWPTVAALAAATEEEVAAAWAGLGFYRRCRNLHLGAKRVAESATGEIPCDVHALKALPGIGDYTAGAISSIAFGKPEAVVDGNVVRVLCRMQVRLRMLCALVAVVLHCTPRSCPCRPSPSTRKPLPLSGRRGRLRGGFSPP